MQPGDSSFDREQASSRTSVVSAWDRASIQALDRMDRMERIQAITPHILSSPFSPRRCASARKWIGSVGTPEPAGGVEPEARKRGTGPRSPGSPAPGGLRIGPGVGVWNLESAPRIEVITAGLESVHSVHLCFTSGIRPRSARIAQIGYYPHQRATSHLHFGARPPTCPPKTWRRWKPWRRGPFFNRSPVSGGAEAELPGLGFFLTRGLCM
jgi:hypothetical protein